MPLEMFLLDASDSYLHDILTGMRGIWRGGATDELWHGSPQFLWHIQHAEAFSGVGLQRPSRASLEQYASGGPVSCAAWFLQQPLRKQEVAFFAAVTCPPAGPEMTVDIGQDIRRVHVATSRSASDAAAVQCFCEKSEPWLVRARRYLTGRERLAIHGISLREVTKVENDGFLAALAGHSFSAPVFMSAFVAGCQG